MTTQTIELTVTLRVCPMTAVNIRALRAALIGVTAGPATHLIVDLREMDDHHEMSIYALLAERARTTTLANGNMTAVGPSPRLGHLLIATGIPVARSPLTPHPTARCEALSIGTCAA